MKDQHERSTPSRARVQLLSAAAATMLTLSACGGETGQAVQDQATKQTTRQIDRIVRSADKIGRNAALREIDRLERAANNSRPIKKAADRARAELNRRTQ